MTEQTFAIIGTGRIAGDYLNALQRVPELRLVGVADVREEVANAIGERWKCRAFADPVAMLESVEPQTVLIAVPPVDHEAVTLQCLERGAHVLCEKPFALHASGAERMLAAADARGLHVTMSAKFRHVVDVLEAKAMLETSVLGDLVFASNTFASEVAMRDRWNAEPSRSGGGVLIDNGTHSVDLLRYLCGRVVWVQATRGVSLQSLPVEDSVRMTLGFESGLLANVDLSWSVSTHSPWYLSIHGSAATARLGWKRSVLQRTGEADDKAFGVGYDKVDALARQLVNFTRAATGSEPPLMKAADVLASVTVIEAAYASLADDGVRVVVPRA